jgi:putative transposase
VIKDRPGRLELIYLNQPLYFVTFCTRNRKRIPSLECAHSTFKKYAERGFAQFAVVVGRYAIMPDHVHLFVAVGSDSTLSLWVGGLKRAISVGLQIKHRLWQPGFFDHIVRSNESYAKKWEYVRENPVRAGLVKQTDDWPFQGEIVLIDRG